MGEMVRGLCQIVVSALRSKRDLILEKAAPRHQLMDSPLDPSVSRLIVTRPRVETPQIVQRRLQFGA